MSETTTPLAPSAAAFGAYLSATLGADVRVEVMQRVAMGQSRAMYLLDTVFDGSPRRLVARVEG